MNDWTSPVDIRPDHLEIVQDIMREHLPAGFRVSVFGSRANWTTKDSSDLDLAVEGAGKLDDKAMVGLEIAFEESDLPYTVDVVDMNAISPEFKRIVEDQKVPIGATRGQSTYSDEWEEKPFQEVIDFREGPGILAKDFREDGVPLVRLAGLIRGASVLEGCNYLDPESVVKRWDQFRLELGDVLLSTSASLGRIAVVGEEGIGAIPYTGIIRMRPRYTTVHGPFIRYLLEGPDFQQQCEIVGVGSVIRHFGPMHLRQMTLKVPPLPDQRAIAHILGTLDDKIELNRRMNQTLEEMSRAIFQDWFVDFGPTRAKMEGLDPYLPPELWNLFPDELVDSEMGEIPEGWKTKPLDEIATFLNGLALQKYPPNKGPSLPVIKIAQLKAGHTQSADSASVDVPSKYHIHDGDVLFSWSGSLELEIWTGGEGALNQHLFKVDSDAYPKWLYYLWVREHLQVFRAIAADKTTTMGHIQRRHLSESHTVLPDSVTLEAMNRHMQPLLDKSTAVRIASRTLAWQRQTLLPQIMSGNMSINLIGDA